MDYMMRSEDEKSHMSHAELAANADLLMIAGSETTASLLSGVTFWLLKTPAALHRLTQEVRSTFDSDSDMTFRAVSTKLPYMLACLDEGLRLYPPVPSAFVRKTLPGAPTRISGWLVPEHVRLPLESSLQLTSELDSRLRAPVRSLSHRA